MFKPMSAWKNPARTVMQAGILTGGALLLLVFATSGTAQNQSVYEIAVWLSTLLTMIIGFMGIHTVDTVWARGRNVRYREVVIEPEEHTRTFMKIYVQNISAIFVIGTIFIVIVWLIIYGIRSFMGLT